MTESSVHLRLLDFVQCVMERPWIYTEQGSYYEVLAFLKGFFSSLPVGHFKQALWFEFLEWLQVRFLSGEGRLLVRFREGFTDDRTALEALYGLYNEFLQQEAAAPIRVQD